MISRLLVAATIALTTACGTAQNMAQEQPQPSPTATQDTPSPPSFNLVEYADPFGDYTISLPADWYISPPDSKAGSMRAGNFPNPDLGRQEKRPNDIFISLTFSTWRPGEDTDDEDFDSRPFEDIFVDGNKGEMREWSPQEQEDAGLGLLLRLHALAPIREPIKVDRRTKPLTSFDLAFYSARQDQEARDLFHSIIASWRQTS